jgi:ABC-type transport system substrate-binding protein
VKVHRSRLAGRRGLAALVLPVLLVSAACSSGSKHTDNSNTTSAGGTLRLAVVGLDTLDPQAVVPTNQADMVAVSLLDRSLSVIDPRTQTAKPALATSWSNNGSGGLVGRTWTFHLDPHARFADGNAVTPNDVIFSLSRAAIAGSSTLPGARLDVIDGYAAFVARRSTALAGLRAGSDGTVQITTGQPSAELPELLASPTYSIIEAAKVPAKGLSALPPGTLVSSQIVGAGPFVVESDQGGTLTLTRASGSKAQVAEVQLIRETDSAAAVTAVRDGKADWAAVAPADKETATGGSIDHLDASPLGAEEFFGINLASPTFANPFFRQAILKAVDRKAVVAKVLPGLVVSNGVVPMGVPGALDDPCGGACSYDKAAAEALLKKAFPGGRIPIVEIDTDADPSDVQLSNAVAFYLAAVGIHVKVVPHTFVDYQRFITTGKQQLFRTGWVGMWPSAGAYLDPLFRSTSLDNSTAFKSTRIDGRLDAAQATTDEHGRQDIYANVERTIMADSAVLPIVSYEQIEALSAHVQDYAPQLDGTFDVLAVRITS